MWDGVVRSTKRQNLLTGWTEEQFEETRDDWWRCLFQLERYDMENRKFAGEILADGVGVSIVMRRKKCQERMDEEAEITRKRREDRASPVKTKSGPKKGRSLKKEHKLPQIDLGTYDRVLGLDPGRKSLFVTCDMKNENLRCSTKEFYHDARYREGNRKSKRGIEKDESILEAVRNMPSNKTCDMTSFERYVVFLLPRLDRLLLFFQQRKFRNQRFKRYIYCRKKLRALCQRITGG